MAVGGILLVAYVVTSWIGAGILLMPPRKALRPWQNAWLAHPALAGLRIERRVSDAGVPYLQCEPDAAAGPSLRGRILRAQLAAAGIAPGRFGEVRGTLVLLHGWGMRKEDLLITAERFCAAGFRCLIPDLPGHGENAGPCAGFGCDGVERFLPREVLESAARNGHFAARPAALWGLSMGGACAIQAAAATPETWDSLVVVSAFDALDPVVRGALGRAMGGWLATILDPGLEGAVLLRGGFLLGAREPLASAARLRVPTFLIHGRDDDLIPVAAGRRLYRAAPVRRKRWLEVRTARHGNVLGTPQHVFVEMAAWMLGVR
jgi:pimeloyl-ACP methyl ester carboxylesterase